jgi:hypothetical protein
MGTVILLLNSSRGLGFPDPMKRRSRLGGDVAHNLITLCVACHEDRHWTHR